MPVICYESLQPAHALEAAKLGGDLNSYYVNVNTYVLFYPVVVIVIDDIILNYYDGK